MLGIAIAANTGRPATRATRVWRIALEPESAALPPLAPQPLAWRDGPGERPPTLAQSDAAMAEGGAHAPALAAPNAADLAANGSGPAPRPAGIAEAPVIAPAEALAPAPLATNDVAESWQRAAQIAGEFLSPEARFERPIVAISGVDLALAGNRGPWLAGAFQITPRGLPADTLLASLPDLPAPTYDRGARKAQFVAAMLPLIDSVNQHMLALRFELGRIRAGGKGLPDRARRLAALCDEFEVPSCDLDELRQRIDIVPPSLALAQAGQESGWGSSHMAQAGHAPFGQMRFAVILDADGHVQSVPRPRPFTSLLASVAAYIHNLNTHPAYAAFRRERAKLRSEGALPSGHHLAPFIALYSERGAAYTQSLRTLIRDNGLETYDRLAGIEQIARSVPDEAPAESVD